MGESRELDREGEFHDEYRDQLASLNTKVERKTTEH